MVKVLAIERLHCDLARYSPQATATARTEQSSTKARTARRVTDAECEALQAEIRATMWEDML
jgi:hypothetical protein